MTRNNITRSNKVTVNKGISARSAITTGTINIGTLLLLYYYYESILQVSYYKEHVGVLLLGALLLVTHTRGTRGTITRGAILRTCNSDQIANLCLTFARAEGADHAARVAADCRWMPRGVDLLP